MLSPAASFRLLLDRLHLGGVGQMLVFSSVIGLVTGLGAIVFNYACGASSAFFLDWIAGYRPATPAGEHELLPQTSTSFSIWMLPAVAAVGGLLSALVVRRFAPGAKGHGTDSAIDAYHNREGDVPLRVSLIKIVASALTIGSGGSGGREGPIAQIGAGFGSTLGRLLRRSARERRIMLAAGMGAGVGSIFHAPLAGALFAAEIMYSDAEFESDALIPAAVSTIVAYCVFCLHSGFEPLFDTPKFAFGSPWELLPYTVLALFVTAIAAIFAWVFNQVHDRCELTRRVPGPLLAGLGGGLTGLIGVGAYSLCEQDMRALDVLSFGYGALQDALLGNVGISLLAVLAIGKIVTTSISIGSGGSGGIFGPSMVIGGCAGGIVGKIADQWFPEIVSHPGAYVAVGMAGFFAAVGKVPISTLVMVSEMTGNYALLLPSLWVCSLAFLLSRSFTLYRSQVRSRIESPAHQHEMFVNVLGGLRVQDLEGDRDFVSFRENTTLNEVVHVFAETTQHYFPVVDADGLMTGILSANDVRRVVEEVAAGGFVIASYIANAEVITLAPTDDLDVALKRFVALDVDALPVVDPESPQQVLSMLSRRDLIMAYNSAREAWAKPD